MRLRLRNVEKKKKKVCPFFLLDNLRPLSLLQEPQTSFSSLGTPDFLSTCLGIDSQRSLLKEWLPSPGFLGFPGSAGKESGCSVGDLGLSPGLEKSPGEGKATPSSILA